MNNNIRNAFNLTVDKADELSCELKELVESHSGDGDSFDTTEIAKIVYNKYKEEPNHLIPLILFLGSVIERTNLKKRLDEVMDKAIVGAMLDSEVEEGFKGG